MNYTKGKWEIKNRSDENMIWVLSKEKKLGDIIASIETSSINKFCKEEAEANAKLIAAAPKLYEALLCLTEAIRPHVMKMNIKKSFNEHVALNAADKVLYELTGKVFGTIEPDHAAPIDHSQEQTKLYSIREHDGTSIISFVREKDGCYFELGRTANVIVDNAVIRTGKIAYIFRTETNSGLAVQFEGSDGITDASLLQHVTPIY